MSRSCLASGWIALWIAGCVPAAAPPAAPLPSFGDATLAGRVAAAEAQLAAAGGTVARRFGPWFLDNDGQVSQPVQLDGGSCWLLLGLAGSRVADLDLFLFDVNGRRIDVDQERDAHPVIVQCPDRDLQAVAVVHAYDGDGEAFLGVYRFPAGSAPQRGGIDFDSAQPSTAPTGEPADEARLRIDRTMSAEGFHPLGESEHVELSGRSELSRTHRVAAGRCLGVGLLGDPDAGDLELRLRLGSRQVADDHETGGAAHASYCAEADVDLQVQASSGRGAAGATLIYYDASPAERVFVTPGELPDEPNVAGRGGGPTFEQSLAELDRRMRAAGYAAEGEPIEGTLATGGEDDKQLQLNRGSCYEFAGLPQPDGIRDLDLMLDDEQGNRVAEDRAETNDPQISYCPEQSAKYTLRVVAYDGAGAYTVRGYRLSATIRDLPGVAGRLAAAYTREAAQLHARGFHPSAVPDRRPAESGRQSTHTLHLHYGSCYAIVAVASADDMDLDVEVRDYMMRSLAVDTSGDPDALVYVCPDRTADYYAIVSVANNSGQYLLGVFESKSE